MKKRIPFSLTLPKGGRYVTRDGRYATSWHYFQDAIEHPFVAIINRRPYMFTAEGKFTGMGYYSVHDLLIEISEEKTEIFVK